MKSQFRYIMCFVDTTVFPANGPHLQAAVQTLATLLSMSSNMVGLVLYPLFQSQTTANALVKHKHLLDNSLMKGGLTLVNPVQVLFSKPDSTARDNRPLSQPAMACFHTHFGQHDFQQKSGAVRQGKMGPCPLLRIADFLGYDGDLAKPGASARVEQNLDLVWGYALGYVPTRLCSKFYMICKNEMLTWPTGWSWEQTSVIFSSDSVSWVLANRKAKINSILHEHKFNSKSALSPEKTYCVCFLFCLKTWHDTMLQQGKALRALHLWSMVCWRVWMSMIPTNCSLWTCCRTGIFCFCCSKLWQSLFFI